MQDLTVIRPDGQEAQTQSSRIGMRDRRVREVRIGSVTIGGDFPVAIQSMTTTDTRDVRATLNEIHRLEEAGCEIIRVAVPDDEAAAYNVGEILFSNQKTDEAIRYFELAAKIRKDWPKPYHKLGFVYLNKGDYAKSLENFKAFIALDPGNPEVPNVKNVMEAIEKMKKDGRPS